MIYMHVTRNPIRLSFFFFFKKNGVKFKPLMVLVMGGKSNSIFKFKLFLKKIDNGSE